MENDEERTEVIPITELFSSHIEYRGLKLKNGMQVLLIRNKYIDVCEVALNVSIGSHYDPCHIQGMAHLMEHVISTNMHGISHNEFAKTLHEYGGSSNASTSSENTTYSFEARNITNRLLQLFADFIFEPSFDPSVIESEVKAIESEHIILSTDDNWRLREFIYAHWRMSDSPFPIFFEGNLSTLQRETIETELRDFHNKFYSANVMSLCIASRENLDSLQTTVEDIFSSKPNRSIEIMSMSAIANMLPQLADDYKTAWSIVPTLPKKTLRIYFPLPLYYVNFGPGTVNYICWMLRDRRQGSLLEALKNRNWCTFIACEDKYNIIEQITCNILIELTLTQQGLNHINDIITLIFQYLRLLPEGKTRDGHYYVFEQNYLLGKNGGLPGIARNMNVYPLETILQHCIAKCTVFRKDGVDEILEDYLVPEYIIYCVMAKENGNITNEITRWYQTKYIKHEIQHEQILHWQSANIIENININERNEELMILQNNDFEWIMTSVARTITSNTNDMPIKIYRKYFLRIWRSISNKLENFELYFQFYCKETERDSYRNCNLNNMFAHLLQDYMSHIIYSAEMVDLTINFRSNIYGISLYIYNCVYKENLPAMVKNIIRNMIDVSVNESRFQLLREQYITSLRENMCAQPYDEALHLLAIHLMNRPPYHKLLEDAMFISATDMKQYIENFLNIMFVKCLIRGNLNDDELRIMYAHIKDGFKYLSPRRKLKINKLYDTKLREGFYKLINKRNSSHKTSCTLIYYQVGSSLFTSKGIQCSTFLRIIQLIISGHTLEYLRLKKHLGYAVKTDILQMYDTCGLAISVVGHNFNTTYVQNEINKFMKDALEIVHGISKDEFEEYHKTAIHAGLDKTTMADDFYGSNRYWQEIVSRNYNFTRLQEELIYMRQATKEDVHKFFKEMLDIKTQRKLSVHVLHPRNLPTNEEARQNIGND